MANEPIHIDKGPDKWDLMVSLMEGNPTHRRHVCFQIPNGHTSDEPTEKIEVAITALEQEDGSGKSWLFKGYLKGKNVRRGKIHGYYSTQSRSGWYTRGDPKV